MQGVRQLRRRHDREHRVVGHDRLNGRRYILNRRNTLRFFSSCNDYVAVVKPELCGEGARRSVRIAVPVIEREPVIEAPKRDGQGKPEAGENRGPKEA